ncbi:hypothetical protein Adu01nite_24830 [Paractinoplanes durhamensis]|uniref:Uncharacterized protein n=1 Tax=Paractinoplanes durhamensis TaxID=113563 RepID=A0ABQ3YU97_9ACTN|nr:hypothetical protein Adu01nite_24830 [Actinoplanes durhamensis]
MGRILSAQPRVPAKGTQASTELHATNRRAATLPLDHIARPADMANPQWSFLIVGR